MGHRVVDRRAHWRHMANTVAGLCAAAMCGSTISGGDAVCSEMTLGNRVIVKPLPKLSCSVTSKRVMFSFSEGDI